MYFFGICFILYFIKLSSGQGLMKEQLKQNFHEIYGQKLSSSKICTSRGQSCKGTA